MGGGTVCRGGFLGARSRRGREVAGGIGGVLIVGWWVESYWGALMLEVEVAGVDRWGNVGTVEAAEGLIEAGISVVGGVDCGD